MLLVKSVTKDLACELVISEEVVKPSQLVVADYVTQEVQSSGQEEVIMIYAIPKATKLLLTTATVGPLRTSL